MTLVEQFNRASDVHHTPGVRRVAADGTVSWKFHQSDLNSFFMCPEQARLSWTGNLPRKETDAANLGTAMHAGIEVVVKGGSVSEGREAAVAEWRRLEPSVVYVQARTAATVERKVILCFDAWVEHVLPQLPQMIEVERKFEVPFGWHEGEQVLLGGAMDGLDEFYEAWDWKTAGRPYEKWECDRFKIQPTVYCAAIDHQLAEMGEQRETYTFNYAVMTKNSKTPQVLPIDRHHGHFDWLRTQVMGIIDLAKAELQAWPLNDQGWHCSAKWCGAWDACKGAVIG